MHEFEIRTVPRQPVAAIRLSSSLADIGADMGEAFGRLYHALRAAGVEPAGMPLARYLDMGGPTIEYECAVPVDAPFPAGSGIEAGEVGGGEVVFAVHVGPYEAISQTWQAAMAWMQEQGRRPGGPGWEAYLDDPATVEPAKLRTEIYLPLE